MTIAVEPPKQIVHPRRRATTSATYTDVPVDPDLNAAERFFGREPVSYRITVGGVEYILLRAEIARALRDQTVCQSIVWATAGLLAQRGGGAISGLLTPDRLHNPGFRGLDKPGPCVQVHFNGANHFLASAWNPTSRDVKHELWLCYSQGEEELRGRNGSVQDQVNSVDCAFFALAFAA
ncbi:hypothetical protein RvY_15707 [Ramazzottius varieornatus]|uniref:Uncharacterized protein n=1 Tax=Ramazzottius varieornatus TaxID=947166 RepID=A0A1D1VVW2_RAMVA|nr:hypothetical protein RvY_15707 [Ramazzottius varieornatus]